MRTTMPIDRITVAHSPDSDDAFMFFGLASGAVETGGLVVDQVLADIETLNRAAFDGHVRSHRRVVSRLRAPRGQVRAAAARRQHGRQLRPDRRREDWRTDDCEGAPHRDSRDADDRVSHVAAVRARLRVRRGPVRRDSAGRPRWQGGGGPAHPRGPADVSGRGPAEDRRPRRMVGGARRAACRCPSAATSSAATSARR